MAGRNWHVVPHGNEWAVSDSGNERVSSIRPTLADAHRAEREIAINRRSEVVIHHPDGRIRENNSYGHDPNPPER